MKVMLLSDALDGESELCDCRLPRANGDAVSSNNEILDLDEDVIEMFTQTVKRESGDVGRQNVQATWVA